MMKPVFTFVFSVLLLAYACTLPMTAEKQPDCIKAELICEYPVVKPVITNYSDDAPDLIKYSIIIQNDVHKNEYIKMLENKIKALCGGGKDGFNSPDQQEQNSGEKINTLFGPEKK